jgi:hypothetical protein
MAVMKTLYKKGAGKKTGISEIRYIDMDISEINTFDDVIIDMSISNISRAKNGHIGLDISKSEYIEIDIEILIYPDR